MTHVNEERLRTAYAAFARGDMDAYWSACRHDFAFNVPGGNRISGRYQGKERFLELIGTVMTLTGGVFREEVIDVLANDAHGVVLAEHHLSRDGKEKGYRTTHVYNIQDGEFVECWEQPEDPIAFDDAWS